MKKIIFVLTFLLLSFLDTSLAKADGASLLLSPSSGNFRIGGTFDVSIILNSGGNNINAIKADLEFDPQKIQIVDPATGTSFITVWTVPPSYSNTKGTLSLQGGVPSPGINSSSAQVLSVTFRVMETGETTIKVLDSSKVLLDDGKATNVLNSFGSGKYVLSLPPPEGPIVSSSTHPDQNKWYKNNNVSFSWNKDELVSDFSYLLDDDPQGIPDDESEGSKSSTSFSNLRDGIWYFHIKAKKDSNWGGISHYLVKIDASSPASFDIRIDPATKTSFSQPIVSFITTDSFSGLDHYEIKLVDIDPSHIQKDSFFIETSSPYQLPNLEVGRYLVVVKAYDEAGNWQEESVEIEIASENLLLTDRGIWLKGIFISWWPILIIFLVLVIASLLALMILWQKEKRRERELALKLRERERDIIENLRDSEN